MKFPSVIEIPACVVEQQNAGDLQDFADRCVSEPQAVCREVFGDERPEWLAVVDDLGRFASAASRGVAYRKAGEIQRALAQEELADTIYKQLPQQVRW